MSPFIPSVYMKTTKTHRFTVSSALYGYFKNTLVLEPATANSCILSCSNESLNSYLPAYSPHMSGTVEFWPTECYVLIGRLYWLTYSSWTISRAAIAMYHMCWGCGRTCTSSAPAHLPSLPGPLAWLCM